MATEKIKPSQNASRAFKVLLVILIAAGAWLAYLATQKQQQAALTQAQSFIKTSWDKVVNGNELLNYEIEQAADLNAFRQMGLSILEQSQLVRQEQQAVKDERQSQSVEGDVFNAYQETLTAYEDFLSDLQFLTSTKQELTDTAITALGEKGDVLHQAVKVFRDRASFINRDLSAGTYDLNLVIKALRDADLEAKKAAQAEEEKAKEEEQKRQAAEKEAQDMASKFAQAYINGDAAQVKRCLTDAYEKEFNYDQLTGEYRAYWKPTSYRLLETKRVNDSRYEVTVRYTIVRVEDPANQHFEDHTYVLVLDPKYGKWLIDRESYSGE